MTRASSDAPVLRVRPFTPADVDLRVDYFHRSTDDHLRLLGVDRARLPPPAQWRAAMVEDLGRPVADRTALALLWELDGAPVGFSTADRIETGEQAHMHLHLFGAADRGRGLGTAFVRATVPRYFELLGLRRLYCEPNALNVAPNRTLQRAGFRYVCSHRCTPGPINFEQVTTRWVTEGLPAA